MKSVLYLHGLESKQGGAKIDFLASQGTVHAPAMAYKIKAWSVDELIEMANKCNPDLIIGSSMGGYFADVLGSHTSREVLLFNPALHSRSIDYNFNYGKQNYKRTIILGMLDTVVLPECTKKIAGDTAKIIEVAAMGHRTPLDTFKAIYTQLFVDETV
ncbi:MAG: YqiA/YcfP family alpha/beta fold hydrolase [Flavobacteriaceae bacterium]